MNPEELRLRQIVSHQEFGRRRNSPDYAARFMQEEDPMPDITIRIPVAIYNTVAAIFREDEMSELATTPIDGLLSRLNAAIGSPHAK
jgi:hypothetical protein